MKITKDSIIVKRIGLCMILGIFTVLHFALTFVLTLFVLSTLNILNERLLHLGKLDYIEIAAAAVICIISIVVFFRSFSKVTQFVKTTFFRDTI